ncbi:MAG TPA: hypothetical protein VGW77_13630 [Candidatus Binatia bacterium]|nr:hypothetical protein [Candidatus Binatia bacterium]
MSYGWRGLDPVGAGPPGHVFLRYGNASADVSSVDEIKTQLAKLEVNYLIVDPLAGYAQGKATLRVLEELVSSYSATAKMVLPALTVSAQFKQ